MLDRRRGPDPPAHALPSTRARRRSPREADVHLAPRDGTNLALMNGLIRELLARRLVRPRRTSTPHTLGFEELRAHGRRRTRRERVARDLRRRGRATSRAAAELIGTCERLLSTVLQGFYQSQPGDGGRVPGQQHPPAARACSAARAPACCQMNGQPTAQNTRETGADGDLPGFRNWDNPEHIRELAELWNVDAATIPHWAPPTHAMQIFRYAEQGSIELLWISATNPAVSLPDLGAHPRGSWRARSCSSSCRTSS